MLAEDDAIDVAKRDCHPIVELTMMRVEAAAEIERPLTFLDLARGV
jgi:hypothetical protein